MSPIAKANTIYKDLSYKGIGVDNVDVEIFNDRIEYRFEVESISALNEVLIYLTANDYIVEIGHHDITSENVYFEIKAIEHINMFDDDETDLYD